MKTKLLLFIIVISFMASGCALLQIPGQVIGGTFGVIGKLLGIASKMPMPPPGVF